MINWTKSAITLDTVKVRDKVYSNCDNCFTERLVTYRDYLKRIKDGSADLCRKCTNRRNAGGDLLKPTVGQNIMATCKTCKKQYTRQFRSQDDLNNITCLQCTMNLPEVKEKLIRNLSDDEKDHIRIRSKINWTNNEYRHKTTSSLRALWANPEWAAKQKIILANAVNSPGFREKVAAGIEKSPIFKGVAPSRPHQIISALLTDMGITHINEKAIGPYNFDIFIEDHKLLLEIQGDYWHASQRRQDCDRRKAEYIENYHPDLKVKYLWEHEIYTNNYAKTLICDWTGINQHSSIDFDFKDVTIRPIDSQAAAIFFGKYHYFGMARTGTPVGAFINDILIAACGFNGVTRLQSATRLGYKSSDVRELSRFCIHPAYQKPNMASWFISKCVRFITTSMPQLKCLISFADETFGNLGTIYKAANWTYDGEVEPSYWYVKNDGWVMHKKTLWDHAKKMSMSESEYASQYGYKRINGGRKFRFIYKL